MCLAQGHNTVVPVRLEPAAPRSQVKHCTTEPLRSLVSLANTTFTIFSKMTGFHSWNLVVDASSLAKLMDPTRGADFREPV